MTMIKRRNPRTEHIARNRLHPRHQEIIFASAQEVIGPNGLIRKNPHALGFIGPNGIKRIDRLSGNPGQAGFQLNTQTAVAELPLITLENPDNYIVVVPDLTGGRLTAHDKDVLGQARQLADGKNIAVIAVVFGGCKESHFDLAGVDRLLWLEGSDYDDYCPELKIAALMTIEQQWSPQFWLFPDSIHGGAELGSRLSAKLAVRAATQVWQVNSETVTSRGGSQMIDIQRPISRILLLAEECAEPVRDQRYEARMITVEKVPAVLSRLKDCGQVAVDPNQIALAEAEFILSAGNGVTDWALFHQAANVLGATEGASRVAVDNGHMPRFRQVGATGTWVTARVYVAVGISGAIQHLQGIGQCDKVIAINTDPGCDMVKRADLSVIGDSQAILKSLTDLVQAYQQRGQEHVA